MTRFRSSIQLPRFDKAESAQLLTELVTRWPLVDGCRCPDDGSPHLAAYQALRAKVVEAHGRLVLLMVGRLAVKWGGSDIEDLQGVGYVGLHRAVDKYDPVRGLFSTYACRWIKQAVMRFGEGDQLVPVPSCMFYRSDTKRPKVVSLGALPDEEHERIPAVKEAAAAEVFGREVVSDVRDTVRKVARQRLTYREQQVVAMRFGSDMTLEAIGNAFDLSRERIRQIEQSGLRRLASAGVMTREWGPADPESEAT